MKKTNKRERVYSVKLVEGKLCGHNCSDGCIYWNPHDRDSNGRQYCSYYNRFFYPRERQGCLSYKA